MAERYCKSPPPRHTHRVSAARRVFAAQEATPEPQQNKYTAKPKKKLQSRHLLQQDTRTRARGAAPILEQQVSRAESHR